MEHRGDAERPERADRERTAGGQQEHGLDVKQYTDEEFSKVRVGDLLNAAFWREVEGGFWNSPQEVFDGQSPAFLEATAHWVAKDFQNGLPKPKREVEQG